jgi:hypothetical protein
MWIVLGLTLWIWTFIDCLLTPEEEVRHLPKVVWVLIILLFGEVLVGPVAWLIAGRARQRARAGRYGGQAGHPADKGRPQRVLAPDDDPEFLASLSRQNQQQEMLKRWESDLRRREEELRRQSEEGGSSNAG